MKKQLQQMLDRARFLRPYGFRVVSADKNKCMLELPHKAALERPGGIINGPALMAAADCAICSQSRLASGSKATRSLRVNTAFLAPAKGGTLRTAAFSDWTPAHLRRRRRPQPKGNLFTHTLRNVAPHDEIRPPYAVSPRLTSAERSALDRDKAFPREALKVLAARASTVAIAEECGCSGIATARSHRLRVDAAVDCATSTSSR